MFGKLSQLDRIACAVMASLVVMVSMVVATERDPLRNHTVAVQPVAVQADCRIVDVPDGETVGVELSRKMRVRLFDATKEPEQVSVSAREHLRALAENCDAVLYIPEKSRPQTEPWFLPDTVAGSVRLVNDRATLAQHQVTAGYGPRSQR